MARQITPEAAALLKRLEGLRLKVYKDIAGYPTVGWGCRTNLPVGTEISEEQAQMLFDGRVSRTAQSVEELVRVPLTDNEFSSLVLFSYNEGTGRLATSTLLRLLNEGKYAVAAEQLLQWDKYHDPETGEVRVSSDLQQRRALERQLFLKPDEKDQTPSS